MAATTFEVHLADASADEAPVTSERLDFYDSRVWVQLEAAREFYPYERIAKIREVESTPEPEADEPVAAPVEIEDEE